MPRHQQSQFVGKRFMHCSYWQFLLGRINPHKTDADTPKSASDSLLFNRFSRSASVVSGFLCLAYLLGIVGCWSRTSSDGNSNSRPFQGQELSLVVPQSLNLRAIWEVLLQEWSSQSGASHRFVEITSTESLAERLVREESSGGSFVVFPLNRLHEIDTQLGPLTISETEFDSRDIFKGLRERALSCNRQLIANPVSVPILLCYYRSDLLRAARRNAPETWDDYLELVESLDRWAPGCVAVEPLSPDFRATTFFARSLAYCKHPENYSVWFDADSAKPTLDTPGFVKAIEMAHRTWSQLPREVSQYTPADCRRQLLTGKAAIGLTFEPLSADLATHSANDGVKETLRIDGMELGVCRLPGSRTVFNRNSKKWDTIPAKQVHAPALCGFAGLATGVILPKTQGKAAAASNLLVSLSSPALFDQAFASLPKGPCRESQLVFASTWFGPDLSAEEASQYCDAVALSLRDPQLVFELPLSGADEFKRAVSVDLEPLLRGESTPEQTAMTLQRSFESIIERRGWEAVRDSHRRGLGLSPIPKKQGI